jgi:F-type H+-transporting ATPase subunit O
MLRVTISSPISLSSRMIVTTMMNRGSNNISNNNNVVARYLSGKVTASNSTKSSTPPSTTAATKSHKPPIQLAGVPARYANAVYVAASKASQLDQVETELLSLTNAASKSPVLSSFFDNPLISRTAKTNYVSSLDKISPLTRNLLITMAGNARLNELSKVSTAYTQLMKATRGEVDAKIISAAPLNKTQLNEIQNAMKTQVPSNKTVIIEEVVDPTIVGGLQVQIGDQFLDLSVKSRIDEISRISV